MNQVGISVIENDPDAPVTNYLPTNLPDFYLLFKDADNPEKLTSVELVALILAYMSKTSDMDVLKTIPVFIEDRPPSIEFFGNGHVDALIRVYLKTSKIIDFDVTSRNELIKDIPQDVFTRITNISVDTIFENKLGVVVLSIHAALFFKDNVDLFEFGKRVQDLNTTSEDIRRKLQYYVFNQERERNLNTFITTRGHSYLEI